MNATTAQVPQVIDSVRGTIRLRGQAHSGSLRVAFLRRTGEMVYLTSGGRLRPVAAAARDTWVPDFWLYGCDEHSDALAENTARAAADLSAAGRRLADAQAAALLEDANRGRAATDLEAELDRAAAISPAHAELREQLRALDSDELTDVAEYRNGTAWERLTAPIDDAHAAALAEDAERDLDAHTPRLIDAAADLSPAHAELAQLLRDTAPDAQRAADDNTRAVNAVRAAGRGSEAARWDDARGYSSTTPSALAHRTAIAIPPELAADVAAYPERYRPDPGRQGAGVLVLIPASPNHDRGYVGRWTGQTLPLIEGISVHRSGEDRWWSVAAWALVGDLHGGPRPTAGQRIVVLDAPATHPEALGQLCLESDPAGRVASAWALLPDPAEPDHAVQPGALADARLKQANTQRAILEECPHCARQRAASSPSSAEDDTDGHAAIVRPASSRFIGNDARNGAEAECWECGDRIINHPSDGTYRHAAGVVERAHGEAIAEDQARAAVAAASVAAVEAGVPVADVIDTQRAALREIEQRAADDNARAALADVNVAHAYALRHRCPGCGGELYRPTHLGLVHRATGEGACPATGDQPAGPLRQPVPGPGVHPQPWDETAAAERDAARRDVERRKLWDAAARIADQQRAGGR